MGTRHVNLAGDVTTSPQFAIDTTTGKITSLPRNPSDVRFSYGAVHGVSFNVGSGCVSQNYVFLPGKDTADNKYYIYRASVHALETWEKMAEINLGTFCFFAYDSETETLWYLSYNDKKLYKSTDFGATFSLIKTFTTSNIGNEMLAHNGNIVCFFGNVFGVDKTTCFRSDDDGATWSSEIDILYAGGSGMRVFSIYLNAAKNRIFVASVNYSNNITTLLDSTDWGVTWNTGVTISNCQQGGPRQFVEKNGTIYCMANSKLYSGTTAANMALYDTIYYNGVYAIVLTASGRAFAPIYTSSTLGAILMSDTSMKNWVHIYICCPGYEGVQPWVCESVGNVAILSTLHSAYFGRLVLIS